MILLSSFQLQATHTTNISDSKKITDQVAYGEPQLLEEQLLLVLATQFSL